MTQGIKQVHKVTLTKFSQRQLRDKVIKGNLAKILASINNKSLTVRGWTLSSATEGTTANPWIQQDALSEDAQYRYDLFLDVTYERPDNKPAESNELSAILRNLYTRAATPANGKWTLSTVDDVDYVQPGSDDEFNDDLIAYADVEIPDNFEDHFSHLFGLDPHVDRVESALEAGIISEWANRYHCALIGPPGCGKSDICQSIKQALGEDAVLEFDATATTAAGAIKELTEREILPRVLLVEEIEKADEKAMSFLLSVCDLRSSIRKTTARATVQRDTKLFVIATVNDLELFNKQQAGALSSRFSNKIFFKRPSRETLELILNREVDKVDGNPEWVTPALDYCEEQGITDPRAVSAICLCGRDKLLTGEYQKMMAQTAAPKGE